MRGRLLALAAVIAAAIVAFKVRSLNAAGVFAQVSSGDPLHLYELDPYGFMRRIWLAVLHYPRVALFDRAIGYPDGLPLLSNFGFDFLLATIVRAFGGAHPSRHLAETICAWAIPALGALAPVGGWLVGKRLGGTAAGVLAAWLLALVPAVQSVGRIGRIDQHVIEGPLVLFTIAAAWSAVHAGRRRVLLELLTGALIALSLLCWSGFVVIPAMLGGWAASQRLADAGMKRASAPLPETLGRILIAGAGALLALEIAFLGRAALAIEFERVSLFQPLALLGGGLGLLGLAALVPGLEVPREAGADKILAKNRPRRPRAAAFLLPAAAAMLALAAHGVASGLGYVTGGPLAGSSTIEGRRFSEFGWQGLKYSFGSGVLAYLASAGFVAARALRDRFRSPGDTLLLAWTAVIGVLAARQYPRYAPHLALPLVLALACVAGDLLSRWRRAPLAALAGCAHFASAALPPALELERSSMHNLARYYEPAREVLLWTRKHTPSAGIERGGTAKPPYGVLAPWRYGYWIVWMAERPAVATPLLLRPAERRANALADSLLLTDGPLAAQRLEPLRLRYVLATPIIDYASEALVPLSADGTLMPTAAFRSALNTRLLHDDGSNAGEGLPCLDHFRLLTESDETIFPDTVGPHRLPGIPVAAVKLFERVPGAEITGRARPGARVAASVDVRTGANRSYTFTCESKADARGEFTLRMPYACPGPAVDGGAQAPEPCRVETDGARTLVTITEDEVLRGARKRLR